MISIRRLRVGEADLYREVRLASLREAPYAFSTSYDSAASRSAESWHEQADGTARGSDRVTFIAFSGDFPIGIAALYRIPDEPDTGEILQVWVAPEFRGKGVASSLLVSVFEWAGRNNFRSVKATVTRTNTSAVRFYEKCGFDLHDGKSADRPNHTVLRKQVDLSPADGREDATTDP